MSRVKFAKPKAWVQVSWGPFKRFDTYALIHGPKAPKKGDRIIVRYSEYTHKGRRVQKGAGAVKLEVWEETKQGLQCKFISGASESDRV